MLALSPNSPSKSPLLSRSPSSQPSNPLSTRLYKVLASNFDDESTREALNTLAELYAPAVGSTSSHVQRKSVQRRENDDENEEEDGYDDTPKRVSVIGESVPGDLAARARKNLKRDVESKLAESSRKFLDAFAEVDKVRYIFLGGIPR